MSTVIYTPTPSAYIQILSSHRHPTDAKRLGHRRGRLVIRQHQDNPGAARHFLRRLALPDDLLQLRLLGGRCVDAERLNEHARPYQDGGAKYSVFCTATSYSRD
jgi:hypothetical protein